MERGEDAGRTRVFVYWWPGLRTAAATVQVRNETKHIIGNWLLGTGSYAQAITMVSENNLRGGPGMGILLPDSTSAFELAPIDPSEQASAQLVISPNVATTAIDLAILLVDAVSTVFFGPDSNCYVNFAKNFFLDATLLDTFSFYTSLRLSP